MMAMTATSKIHLSDFISLFESNDLRLFSNLKWLNLTSLICFTTELKMIKLARFQTADHTAQSYPEQSFDYH